VRHMMRFGFAAAFLVTCALVGGAKVQGADGEKHSIKDVMKHVFKKNALKDKAIAGEASDDEKKELVSLLKDMADQAPPKGSEESWKKLTGALVEAGQGVVEGKEGAVEALKKASNCGACHKEHKKG